MYTFQGTFREELNDSLPTFGTAHHTYIWIDGCHGTDRFGVHPAG